jgi:hypothetical protein
MIRNPESRIYMLIEIAVAAIEIDKNANIDFAMMPDAIKAINSNYKYISGYRPSRADSAEIAQHLQREYMRLEASGSTPAVIRRTMRVSAERYLDQFLGLEVPSSLLNPKMISLLYADAAIETAITRGQEASDESSKLAAAQSEVFWATVRTLFLPGATYIAFGICSPLITTGGRWTLRKVAAFFRSDTFTKEADHVLKAKAESESKKSDHEES